MVLFSLVVTRFFLSTISGAWEFIINASAGMGLVLILRWFWWRINAWSEIAAMTSSFGIAAAFFIAGKMGHKLPQHDSLIINVAVTTCVWLAVTYLTPPVNRNTLVKFYQLVRPAGPGWKSVREQAAVGPSPDSFPHAILGVFLGCTFIYAALFGSGCFIYGRTAQAIVWTVLFILSGLGLVRLLPRLWTRQPTPSLPTLEQADIQ